MRCATQTLLCKLRYSLFIIVSAIASFQNDTGVVATTGWFIVFMSTEGIMLSRWNVLGRLDTVQTTTKETTGICIIGRSPNDATSSAVFDMTKFGVAIFAQDSAVHKDNQSQEKKEIRSTRGGNGVADVGQHHIKSRLCWCVCVCDSTSWFVHRVRGNQE